MRIVFVNHTFPPFSWAGSEACVYHLARSLRVLGHDVRVFYRYSDPADDEYRLVEEEFDGIPIARINHTHRFSDGFERAYLNRAISAKFGHWLAGVAPDVVHIHHLTNLSIDLVEETRIRGIPTVMTLHDYWLLCQRGQLLTRSLECCHGPTDGGCRDCLSVQLLKGRALALAARLIRRERSWRCPSPEGGDLTDLAGAEIEAPDRRFVLQTVFEINGQRIPTLQAHPPAAIRRRIVVPERARLTFSMAMHPSTYGAEGEGVAFRVKVDGETVFEHYLDAKHRAGDRGWHEGEVDLSAWAGREIRLGLETAPGPSGCMDFCTAGWSRLQLHGFSERSGQDDRPSAWQHVAADIAHGAAALLAYLSPSAAAGIRHRRRWTEFVFQNVDLFISPSRFLRGFFIRHGLDPKKILHMDNGFILPGQIPDPERPVRHPVRFAYVGTWIPSKGVDLLVKAFQDIDPAKASLFVYGFFPGYDGHEDYEHRLRWAARGSAAIQFKGRYDPRNVYEILSDVDLIVVPSIWWENSPLTIHEAFLAGVPVITADQGGMAELVTDSVSGLLFRHRDWQSLRAVIERVCERPEIVLELRKGIPPVPSMDQHVESLLAVIPMRNEECGMRSEEWGMGNGECGMRSEEWGMRNAE
jgi:glycosyltransferase involved in cell wall biosynthesis